MITTRTRAFTAAEVDLRGRQPSSTLVVEDLHKAYGDVRALRGVSLDVRPGEVCVLLGRNGAGKTTLLSIISGIVQADAGQVVVEGFDQAKDPAAVRGSLGLAPQQLGVYPTATVRENLELFGRLAGVARKELGRRVTEVADALDLGSLLARRVRYLSGGEQRRVHTGMALLHRPPLLLLDEATAGVDPATRAALLDHVRCEAARGAAVVYSTHYFSEVDGLGDDVSVCILDGGVVVARGTPAELAERYGGERLVVGFDGPPPAVLPKGWSSDGSRVVVTGMPSVTAALAALGDDAERVTEVSRMRAGLESVFFAMTGRPAGPSDGGDDDAPRQ